MSTEPNEELRKLLAEVRTAATNVHVPANQTLMAALVNYRAAQLIGDRLDIIAQHLENIEVDLRYSSNQRNSKP